MMIDMRRQRALHLAGAIFNELMPFIKNGEYDLAYNELGGLLYREGVEIITDADRKMAGLPPRNNLGWTYDELEILEARRKEAMLNTKPTPFPLREQPK